jgi:hypothetical protein
MDYSDKELLRAAYGTHREMCDIQLNTNDAVSYVLNTADIDVSEMPDLLISASETGLVDVVRSLLLDNRVDPSARDNEAIKVASKNGHTKIIEILIASERVDPTAQNNAAIRLARLHRQESSIQALLKNDRVRKMEPCTGDKYYRDLWHNMLDYEKLTIHSATDILRRFGEPAFDKWTTLDSEIISNSTIIGNANIIRERFRSLVKLEYAKILIKDNMI